MKSTYAKQAVLTEISQLQYFLANPKDADNIEGHCDRADDILRALQAALSVIYDLENPVVETNYRRMTA